jgi:hypothetical protein
MITIQLRVATPDGTIQGFVSNYTNLRYVMRADGRIGGLSFTVPLFMYDWFNPNQPDMRITVWRSVNNMRPQLEGNTEYLTTLYELTSDFINVTCATIDDVLRRRIIAYSAGDTTYTRFLAQRAGDIMKEIVRQNLGSSVNTALRDGDDTNVTISNLTVSSNLADGAQLSIACSRNNVYDTLQTISQYSMQQGSWIIGKIDSDGSDWTFNTYATAYGVDRRSQTALSVLFGNIENIQYTYDYNAEYNFNIVGGSGTETARFIGTNSIANTNVTLTPYSRREYFYSNPQLRTQLEVDVYAEYLARAQRPAYQFKCDLIQTPTFVRGINYNLGDIVTVWFNDAYYDTRIDVIEVSVDTTVTEKAELRLL